MNVCSPTSGVWACLILRYKVVEGVLVVIDLSLLAVGRRTRSEASTCGQLKNIQLQAPLGAESRRKPEM